MKAKWHGQIIADSENTIEVEGNHYFPMESIHKEYFQPSDTKSVCHWKGEASYLSVIVDGDENKDAAWYYPDPKDAARAIKNRVAFWRGVEVSE